MGTGSAILRWNIDNHSTVTINSVETARNVALSMILNILHRLMIRHGSYYATGQHYCLVTAFLFLLCITTPPSRIMNIMQARAAAAMRAMRVVVGQQQFSADTCIYVLKSINTPRVGVKIVHKICKTLVLLTASLLTSLVTLLLIYYSQRYELSL